jgi:hypothetical protein
MFNEVIILGMGQSRTLCPFDGTPVWGVNNGYVQVQELNGYLNKIFLAHTQHKQVRDLGNGTAKVSWAYNFDQMNKLADSGVEIINIHRCKGLKHKLYPYKRINEKFSANGFFSNTICYMVAYAIDQVTTVEKKTGLVRLQHPFRIRIYGVDMLTRDEYELEKGGIEYWIGYARGLGIVVEINGNGAVCTTCTKHPYGVKFYNLKDVDPWGLLKSGKDKQKLWKDQADLSYKQNKELEKII